MDVAASEFYKGGKYDLDFKSPDDPSRYISPDKLADLYRSFVKDYPGGFLTHNLVFTALKLLHYRDPFSSTKKKVTHELQTHITGLESCPIIWFCINFQLISWMYAFHIRIAARVGMTHDMYKLENGTQ